VTQTLVKSWCRMTLDDITADFSISGDIPSPPGARPDFSLLDSAPQNLLETAKKITIYKKRGSVRYLLD